MTALFEHSLDKLLPEVQAPPPAKMARKLVTRDRSPAELYLITRLQKRMLQLFAATLAVGVLGVICSFLLSKNQADPLFQDTFVVIVCLTMLTLSVLQFVVMMKLGRRVFTKPVFVLVMMLVILWPGVISLAILHVLTNGVLTRNGISNGWLGANKDAINEIDPNRKHESQLPRLGW